MYLGDAHPGLDAEQHRGHLHAQPGAGLPLPRLDDVRDRLRPLGRRGPAPVVQPRRAVLGHPLVLPHRHPRAHPVLPRRAQVADVVLAVHQRARILRGARRDAARVGDQLHLVGDVGLHLQLRHPAQVLPLVDAVQLHPVRGARLGRRAVHGRHLLHAAAAEDGRDQP